MVKGQSILRQYRANEMKKKICRMSHVLTRINNKNMSILIQEKQLRWPLEIHECFLSVAPWS